MSKENQSNLRVGCIGAAAIIIAAIIGLGIPFAQKLADRIVPPLTPTSNLVSPTQEITVGQRNIDCIHPQVLAQQKYWVDKGATGDKYGGWYVELSKPDQLPIMWEALGETHIYQTDTDRTLSPGRWAIYTPFDCRDQFGFSH